MNRQNTITVEQAVAALTDAARKDFPNVAAELKAAGFVGITGYKPLQETPNLDASAAADIGTAIEGRGIYHGTWQPRPNGVIVHAYSDTDFLRDASGRQMLLNWYEARDELARRNSGRRYGEGTEAALHQALTRAPGRLGAYQDGDLVMAPQVLLNGVNAGERVRAGSNTFDLLSGPTGDVFKNISNRVRDASSSFGRWSWSCSEDRGNSSHVRSVRLLDGYDVWYVKDDSRLGVLPFRFFGDPHAAKAVSHLSI